MNFLGLLVESYGTWLLLQRLVDASKDSDIPKNFPFAFAINNRNTLPNAALRTYILSLRGRRNLLMLLQGTRGVCKILNTAVKCFAALSKTHGSQPRNWKWRAWHAENAGRACTDLLLRHKILASTIKSSVSKGNSKSAKCVSSSRGNICIERTTRDVGILRMLSARSRMPAVFA